MSARSFVIQLQAGVGQAILPDHRKMLPGIQYVVDADTFSKISLSARQNVIQVVNVNTDTISTSGSIVPAQVSAGLNAQINPLTLLTTTSQSLTTFSIAGFAAQGASAGGTAGAGAGIGTPQDTLSGSNSPYTLVGPDGARYALVYNGTAATISGGWATVWQDESNGYVSTASGITYQVKQDGQGTAYVISANTTLSGVNGAVTTVGTRQGAFSGIAVVNIPAGYFGFTQVEGLVPKAAVASGTAIGATVAVSGTSNNGYLAVPASTTAAVSSTGVVTGTALANNTVGTVLTTPTVTAGQFFAQVELRSRRSKKPYVRVLNKN
jgi:hypothetical protein